MYDSKAENINIHQNSISSDRRNKDTENIECVKNIVSNVHFSSTLLCLQKWYFLAWKKMDELLHGLRNGFLIKFQQVLGTSRQNLKSTGSECIHLGMS